MPIVSPYFTGRSGQKGASDMTGEEDHDFFAKLLELRRAEKTEPRLVTLPDTFFADGNRLMAGLISQMQDCLLKDPMSKEGNELRIKYGRTKVTIREIVEWRTDKIARHAVSHVHMGLPPPVMLPEERIVFDKIVMAVRDYQKVIEGEGSSSLQPISEPMSLGSVQQSPAPPQ